MVMRLEAGPIEVELRPAYLDAFRSVTAREVSENEKAMSRLGQESRCASSLPDRTMPNSLAGRKGGGSDY